MRKLIGFVILVALVGGGVLGAKRFVSYAHTYAGTSFNPASLDGSRPGYFYLDWREDLPAGAAASLLDSEGLLDFGDAETHGGEVHRDPLRVIQACLGLHDQLLDSRDQATEQLLRRQVEWLMNEAAVVLAGDIPVWPQYYRFSRYGLAAPWISALTQGQAVSLLVRMAGLTGEERYALWAQKATLAFTTSGFPIVWRGPDGLFFEEYPCDPPSHVLNGCLFAWLGLWDWARYSGSESFRGYCLDCLTQIERRVPEYELGNWTRYDVLQERPTSPTYQEIHAALAEALDGITGRPVWRDRALRWRAAANSGRVRSRVFFEVLANRLSEKVLGRPQPKGLGLDDVDHVHQTNSGGPTCPAPAPDAGRVQSQSVDRREIA